LKSVKIDKVLAQVGQQISRVSLYFGPFSVPRSYAGSMLVVSQVMGDHLDVNMNSPYIIIIIIFSLLNHMTNAHVYNYMNTNIIRT